MLDALALAKLLSLLLVCSLGPGLLTARRLRWAPKETFCATLAFSFIWVYGVGFAIAAFSLPRYSYFIVSFFCAAALVFCRRDLARLLNDPTVRLFLAAFLLCFSWTVLHTSLIRSLSGWTWSGDWEEHYRRSRFFLEALPQGILNPFGFAVPARPPFMNVVTAFFMAQVDISFEIYQLSSLFLNTMVFFPIMLIVTVESIRFRKTLPVLLLLVLLNPMILQNVTYPWTRSFTNFYILLAIAFYLLGRKYADKGYMPVAFLFMTAGVLSHYCAAPFAVFLGLHYLWAVLPHRGTARYKELGAIVCFSTLLAATWFGWSIMQYGLLPTLTSNTTVAGGMRPVAIASNFFATIVPHPFRVSPRVIDAWTATKGSLSYIREYFFAMYQTNIYMAVGTISGAVVIWRAARFLRHSDRRTSPAAWFWAGLFTFSFSLGLIVTPGLDPYGVAHICGQPLVILALIFLSTELLRFGWRLKIAIAAGLALDYILGAFIHFRLENRVYPEDPAQLFSHILSSTGTVSFHANLNWVQKRAGAYLFFGDRFGAIAPLISLALLLSACFACIAMLRLLFSLRKRDSSVVATPLPLSPCFGPLNQTPRV